MGDVICAHLISMEIPIFCICPVYFTGIHLGLLLTLSGLDHVLYPSPRAA